MTQDNTELLDPVDLSAEAPEEPSAKMFDSETVQKIVQRERLKAIEKVKREVKMEQESVAAPASSLGGMPQMTEAQIRELIAKEMPAHLEQHINRATNERVVDSFVSKMKAAESKHPGLEETLNQYDYSPGSGMTEVILAANQLENTADVMKEIVDNPHKLASLLTLVRQPYALKQSLARMSDSIKTNQVPVEQGKEVQSKLKSSASAGLDDGNMSVSDFRKMLR